MYRNNAEYWEMGYKKTLTGNVGESIGDLVESLSGYLYFCKGKL